MGLILNLSEILPACLVDRSSCKAVSCC